MLSVQDVALMRLAYDADLGGSAPLPAGFTAMTNAGLALPVQNGPMIRGPGTYIDQITNGLYNYYESRVLATVGTLNGVTTATLAFSDATGESASVRGLTYIADQYGLLSRLIAAFDALVTRQGVTQVAVTGNGLGGAMAQFYMAAHADTATVQYRADTFGSSGAAISAGTDPRINLVQIADDPAVYVGQNRASIPAQIQADPTLASTPLFTGGQVYPGLTTSDLNGSLPSFTTNYVNRGTVTLLPNADGSFTQPGTLAAAAATSVGDASATSYLSRMEALTGSLGEDQAPAPITATTTGVAVYRFFDTSNGSHFYTDSQAERDTLIQTVGTPLSYEGFSLNAVLPANDPAAAPVFRFFDTNNGSHFLTASTGERDGLQATRPDLTFEGIAFYEHATPQANDTPVYRFFDTTTGSHFFTPSQTERGSVIATRADLVNEGIAFYTAKS